LTALHLLFPAFLRLSFTDRSIDEPAEMPELKFPGRTPASLLSRTFSHIPAAELRSTRRIVVSKKKQHLPFDVYGNFSPALFKALHSFKRSSQ
jgi:hypothetical protein